MNASIRSLVVGLFLVSASLLSGCGGSSAKTTATACSFNSDCGPQLICTFGLCHAQCQANGDCMGGGMCLKTTTVSDAGVAVSALVCSAPTEAHCVYNSNCVSPLVCGRDEVCRNQCVADVDCAPTQKCTASGVCALATAIDPVTGDVPLVTAGRTADGGVFASGSAGASGAAGATGAAGSGAAGATGAAGLGAAGSGAAGLGAAGSGAAGTTGSAGNSGACGSTPCGANKQCVAGTCQPCGTVGISCCGTGATAACNVNLTCVSGTCACGDAGEACCSGATCNSGLACVNGNCACGGAGQGCCAGKTCTGGLVCGGRSCGCATSCDNYAVLKYDGSVYIQGTPVTNTDGTLFKAKSVSYNGSFKCAIKADATSTVWCWGSNSYGALGTGSDSTALPSSTAPQQVSISTDLASNTPLTGITAISVADSGYSACAVGTAGALWCWGYGASGQLGTGDMANSNYAVPVVDAASAAVTGFKSVSVSYYNACGLKTDNTVWCWGDNYYGEIGNGVDNMNTTTSPRYVVHPTQAAFPVNTVVTSVIANYYNYTNCATTDDGSAWCWGQNGYGDLGNGLNTGYSNVPSQVLTAAGTPLTGAVKVLNWSSRVCALKTDGTIWCWPNTAASPETYYAAQLVDNSNKVAGVSYAGRYCYLDSNDQAWIADSMYSGYQATCP